MTEELILDGVLKSPKSIELYERFYDEPLDIYGKEKPNKYIGEFLIIEQLTNNEEDDCWSHKRIALKDNKLYLIVASEITGYYSGISYSVYEINSLQLKSI